MVAIFLLLYSATALAQGSIFGTVHNSDASTPAGGEISFFGFINDIDAELRTESVVGAGYDAGNWFDDFQNYQGEAAGLPYDYHFFNLANNEAHILSQTIPNNSFQQENVTLASASWPAAPTGLMVASHSETELTITWDLVTGISYHVYRREASSNGSFFRIDDPSGSLSNPGVAAGEYVDNDITPGVEYDYLLVPEAADGTLGAHSQILDSGQSNYLCGDADGSGAVNITDAVFVIQFIFAGGPSPDPLLSGDADCSDSVNITDVVYVIQYIFAGGPIPCAACQ